VIRPAHIGMMFMPANCMDKPATGSFVGKWHLRMPFLFFERETETACRPERRNGEYRGNLP